MQKEISLYSIEMPYLDAFAKTRKEGLEMISNIHSADLRWFETPPIWVKELLAYPRIGKKIDSEIKGVCQGKPKIWRLVDIGKEYQGHEDAALFVKDFDIEVGEEVIVTPRKNGMLLVTKFYDNSGIKDMGIDLETGIPSGRPDANGRGYVWRQDNPRVGPIMRFTPGFIKEFVNAQEDPHKRLAIYVYKQPGTKADNSV